MCHTTRWVISWLSAGRMMMQTVGAFAEFERAMIREAHFRGAAAGAEGRIGGRRKKLDAAKRRERHYWP
jgi:DNA invertase Pin-like site-specific DNA recombinase